MEARSYTLTNSFISQASFPEMLERLAENPVTDEGGAFAIRRAAVSSRPVLSDGTYLAYFANPIIPGNFKKVSFMASWESCFVIHGIVDDYNVALGDVNAHDWQIVLGVASPECVGCAPTKEAALYVANITHTQPSSTDVTVSQMVEYIRSCPWKEQGAVYAGFLTNAGWPSKKLIVFKDGQLWEVTLRDDNKSLLIAPKHLSVVELLHSWRIVTLDIQNKPQPAELSFSDAMKAALNTGAVIRPVDGSASGSGGGIAYFPAGVDGFAPGFYFGLRRDGVFLNLTPHVISGEAQKSKWEILTDVKHA